WRPRSASEPASAARRPSATRRASAGATDFSVTVWGWIRHTIAYQGEYAPVPIQLEREGGRGYAFRLGVRAGFGGQEIARLPINHRANDAPHPVLKEVYSCEVAGQTLEAANL